MFNRILLILTLLSLSAQIWAGDVDIELTTDFDFSRTFVKGQQGTFSLTVTNHGPESTGSNIQSDFAVVVSTDGIEFLTTGELPVLYRLNEHSMSDCNFSTLFGEPLPGQLPLFFFGLTLPNLEPGQSRTCFVDFIVFEEISHRWIGEGLADNELDWSDNDILFGYPFKTVQIPTLNIVSLMILTLLSLLLAYFKHSLIPRL